MTISKNQGRIIAAQAPQSAKRLYAQFRIRTLFVLGTETSDLTFSIVVASYESSWEKFFNLINDKLLAVVPSVAWDF